VEIPEPSFHALIMADLAGLEMGGQTAFRPLADREPRQVDRDDLDAVLAAVAAGIELPVEEDGPPLRVSFRSLEDFHPDRLLARLPFFQAIREMKERVRSGVEEGQTEEPRGEETQASTDPASGAGLLDEIVSRTAGSGRSNGSEGRTREPELGHQDNGLPRELEEFLRKITRPHLVDEPGEGQRRRLEALDEITTKQLRRILRHPRLQTLEALWRGVHYLVRRLETGPRLKVFLLQATRREVVDAARGGDLARVLASTAKKAGVGTGWSVVLLHQSFSSEPEDMEALEGVARTGAEVGTPFLAEVDPSLLEARGTDAGEGGALPWQEIRSQEGARYLSLLLPRFLLRPPYGAEENPCETLDFEELEFGEDPELAHLLWGHPGFLALMHLGHRFSQRGWSFRPGAAAELEGLGPVIHQGDRGASVLPPTEVLLAPGEVQELAEAGFAPVIGRAGERELRLPLLLSIASPAAVLRGPWG